MTHSSRGGDGQLAFLFPGQGARNALSAALWTRTFSPLVDLALAEAGLTLPELESHAGRALERTEVLQPVLAATSLAIHTQLTGLVPDLLLGHSLGELPALAAAGVFSPEDTVRLAARRGALMSRAAAAHPGGLVALRSEAEATTALAADPSLQLAARNAPDEFVLSGPTESLARVKHGQRVPVSGPWHHASMASAQPGFLAAIDALPSTPARTPVLRNADGEPGLTPRDLVAQLTKPVDFIACLHAAFRGGVRTFITVGPGLVLRGLVRKNLGADVRVLTTEDAADLVRTLESTTRSRA